MKKIIFSSFFLIVFLTSLFAAEKSLDGKIGTTYATDSEKEKFGWHINFAFYNEIDPYFVIGLEPGLFWLHWDKKVGQEIQGPVPVDIKADTNTYMIPLLMDAQIRLPNVRDKIHFLPHLTIGIGYSLMIYDYSQPSYTDPSGNLHEAESGTKLYSGFTWQILVGGAFRPGKESNIGFLFELGYRGAKLKKGNLEVDMSGFVINIGIRYPFKNTNNEQSAYGAI